MAVSNSLSRRLLPPARRAARDQAERPAVDVAPRLRPGTPLQLATTGVDAVHAHRGFVFTRAADGWSVWRADSGAFVGGVRPPEAGGAGAAPAATPDGWVALPAGGHVLMWDTASHRGHEVRLRMDGHVAVAVTDGHVLAAASLRQEGLIAHGELTLRDLASGRQIARSHACVATLHLHGGLLTAVGRGGGDAWVIDSRTGRLKRRFAVGDDVVCAVGDADVLYTGHRSGAVRRWDIRTGAAIGSLQATELTALGRVADALVGLDRHGVLRLWDVRNGQLRQALAGGVGAMWVRDGAAVRLCSPQGCLSTWVDGTVTPLPAPAPFPAPAAAPYTGPALPPAVAHNWLSGSFRASVLSRGDEPVRARAWAHVPGGHLAAWSAERFDLFELHQPHRSLSVLPDDVAVRHGLVDARHPGRLALLGEDWRPRLYADERGASAATPLSPATAAAPATVLALYALAGAARPRRLSQLPLPSDLPVDDVFYHPAQASLLLVRGATTYTAIDVAVPEAPRQLACVTLPGRLRRPLMHPARPNVLLQVAGDELVVVDVAAPAAPRRLPVGLPVIGALWHPGQPELLVLHCRDLHDDVLVAWSVADLDAIEPLYVIERLPQAALTLHAFAARPDLLLVTGAAGHPGLVTVYRLGEADGQRTGQLVGHVGPISQVALQPHDPDCLVTCGADQTLRLWSLHDHRPRARLEHAAPIANVCFHPCLPALMLTATEAGTLVWWNTAEARRIVTLSAEAGPDVEVAAPGRLEVPAGAPHLLLYSRHRGAQVQVLDFTPPDPDAAAGHSG